MKSAGAEPLRRRVLRFLRPGPDSPAQWRSHPSSAEQSRWLCAARSPPLSNGFPDTGTLPDLPGSQQPAGRSPQAGVVERPGPGAGTSTLTVKVGPKATLGKHRMSITAEGGGVTRTIPVTLDVLP
jgi:hypothetical protein